MKNNLNKVVITGGAGFIGSNLIKKLLSQGTENICVIDDLSTGKLENIKTYLDTNKVNLVDKRVEDCDNLDSLLVQFISYLVVLFDTDLFISGFAKIEISKGENFLLKGILKGDIYDQSKHGYGVEIKAVSYHQLLVEEGPPSRLRVILDL